MIYRYYIKRIVDVTIAILLLLLTSPLIIISILLLLILNKGNIFFLQKRPGYLTRPFLIIKFKTMLDIYDSQGELLSDELRLTKIGKFIREYSIDELLQLINVINGDMSLVGPRPLLMKYLQYYSKEQNCRHNVRPGITGWAQINGRNELSWEEKFKLDLEYVEKLSFGLDIKILFLTILKVFNRNGISARDHVTMKEFNGNHNSEYNKFDQ